MQFVSKIKSSFVRNSAILITGNVAGQGIALLFYLLLCRIYTPADFGSLSVFLSYCGFLGIVATAGYQYAILLPDDSETLNRVMRLCFLCVAVVSAVCAVAVLLAQPFIYDVYDFSTAVCFWMLPVYVFFYGFWTILQTWHTRVGNFKLLAGYQVWLGLTTSVSKAALWFTKSGLGLAVGTVVGQALSSIIIAIKDKAPVRAMLTSAPKGSIRQTAAKYSPFPKYSFTRDAVNYLGCNMAYMLLSPFFPTECLGFFLMANTLALRPLILVNNALSHNMMQKLSQKLHHGEYIFPFVIKYVLSYSALIAPFFVILYFIVEPLTVLLLGDGWQISGTYITYMLPWLFVLAVVSPLAQVTDILLKQKYDLIFEICSFILRSSALSVAIVTQDFALGIKAYCAACACTTAARGILYVGLAKKSGKP